MGQSSHDGATTPYRASPPLVPDSATSLTDIMVRHIAATNPASGAEALRALRQAFPDLPLTMRVAALQVIMRQRNG